MLIRARRQTYQTAYCDTESITPVTSLYLGSVKLWGGICYLFVN